VKITVNEQTQRFYLALNKWEPAVGHEIKVGKYQFCAIPFSKGINISEVTSGVKVLTIPMTIEIMMVTASKEETLFFLEKLGKQLENLIERTNKFDEQLEKMKKLAIEKLGKKPPSEKVDTDWIFADVSDVLN
jgi:hypothetical protein